MAYPPTFKYTPLTTTSKKPDHTSIVNSNPHTKRTFATSQNIIYSLILVFPYIYLIWLITQTPTATCGLASDILFGKIPWAATVIEQDDKFLTTDPFADVDKWVINAPWDELYIGSWVAIDNPSIAGDTPPGMRMVDVAAEPHLWSEESRGYGIAVMHQIHCIMLIKHSLVQYETRGNTTMDRKHLHHCIETLRKSVMCHGDLTLEHPEPQKTHNSQAVTGWGNTHFCRDWPSITDAIREKAIQRDNNGQWVRLEQG